jgi:hypothetical protein
MSAFNAVARASKSGNPSCGSVQPLEPLSQGFGTLLPLTGAPPALLPFCQLLT